MVTGRGALADEPTFIDRAEALMVPLYREALERWEGRDDGVLQETGVAEVPRKQEGLPGGLGGLQSGCGDARR